MSKNVSKLTSQKFRLEVHAVKVVDGFIVVGLDLSLRSRKLCEFKCLYNPAKESPAVLCGEGPREGRERDMGSQSQQHVEEGFFKGGELWAYLDVFQTFGGHVGW